MNIFSTMCRCTFRRPSAAFHFIYNLEWFIKTLSTTNQTISIIPYSLSFVSLDWTCNFFLFVYFALKCLIGDEKVMCIQYWPPALDKTEVYGDIHIGIVKEEQLANFQIRTFRIWKQNSSVSDTKTYFPITSILIRFCFNIPHAHIVKFN